MNELDAMELTIDCPSCKSQLKKRIGWLKTHQNFSCNCGQAFDAKQINGLITKLKKSLPSSRSALKINLKL